jgi:hypothetical protein
MSAPVLHQFFSQTHHLFMKTKLTPIFQTEKITWWGCGNHVPSVMDSILDEERCTVSPSLSFPFPFTFPPTASPSYVVS